jgi:hypothetical protein
MGGDIMALVGFWPLDGNTNDYSVNNNTGVNNNVTFVNGKIGQAANFDSQTDGINILNVNLSEATAISFAVWINPSTATGPFSRWLSGSIGSVHYPDLAIDVSTRTLRYIFFPAISDWVVTTTTINFNEWTHLVYTFYKSGKVEIYKNSTLSFTNQHAAFTSFSTSYNYMLGSRYDFNNERIVGSLNDFRIYDHALSQKEINELAKAKVLHYIFNKDEELIIDSSGYKRNGTKHGITYTQGRLGSGAYSFDGSNDRIQVNNFLGGSDELTIAFNIYFDTSTQDACAIGNWTSPDTNLLLFHDLPLGWRLIVTTENGVARSIQSNVVTVINNWYHFSVTYNKGIAKFYINGVLEFTGGSTYNSPIRSSASPFFIGTDDDLTRDFDGIIDDYRMYTTALSDTDILDMYQTRAKIDNQGNLYANEFVEQVNGEHYYLIRDFSTLQVQYYKLSTPFNLDDPKVPNNPDFVLTVSGMSRVDNIIISEDGKTFYVAGSSQALAAKYILSTPFDLSTAVYQGLVSAAPTTGGEFTCFSLQDKGKKYYLSNVGSNILQFDLSTPNDITTRTQTATLGGFPINGPGDPAFSPYGTKVIFGVRSGSTIRGGVCSIPFDLATFTETHTYNTPQNDPASVKWNEDGTKFYTRHASPNMVLEFTVSNPYTLEGTTYIRQVFDNPNYAAGGQDFNYYTALTQFKQTGQVIAHEINEVGIDTIAYEGKTYREIFEDGNDSVLNSVTRQFTTNFEFAFLQNNNFYDIGDKVFISYKQNNDVPTSLRNTILIQYTVNPDFGTFISNNNQEKGIYSFQTTIEREYSYIAIYTAELSNETTYDNTFLINLSTTFGSGNEPTQAQMDQLYTEYRQLKTEEQALRIFKDKIHIQGSLNEGGQ